MRNGLLPQLMILGLFLLVMYFFLIRPQKKKEKSIQQMRSNLKVGDEIVTIGGICGKIVKTKENSIVIQVGADKIKFEMTRWSVSSVVNPSKETKQPEAKEEKPEKKPMPKRLRKAEKKGEGQTAEGGEKDTEKDEVTGDKEEGNEIIRNAKERVDKIKESRDASRDSEER